jgi:hypothetical protein
MKSKYIFLSLLWITVSCKKLIQIPNNPNGLTTQQIFSDSADVVAAMLGVYSGFGVINGGFAIGNGGVTGYTGLTSDELVTTNTNDSYLVPLYANDVLPTNTDVAGLWSSAYTGIYEVNVCLLNIEGNPVISTALAEEMAGELKLVRAFYYFNLVNLYGGVPIVTTTDYHTSESIPRSTEDSVYDLVQADLDSARLLLGPSYPSAGRARPNIYTAYALQAKVYLYQKQWQAAANMASAIINSGLYSLVPDPNSVYLDGSTEAIWQLPAVSSYNQTTEAAVFVPYASGIAPTFYLSNTLLNAYEPGDIRKADWIAPAQITVGSDTVTYYYPYRYKNRTVSSPTVEDYMIFRLAEQYLIRAEALAELGKLDSAAADLNIIRARAGLGATTATAQATLLAAIMHERQVELGFEWGNRWFDLKRTGTIDAVLGADKTGWTPTDSLYPVPLIEIDSNPFLKQNPGY